MAETLIERLKGDERYQSPLLRALYSIQVSLGYDDESGGIYVIDQGGNFMNSQEFGELVDGVKTYLAYHGDNGIEQINQYVNEQRDNRRQGRESKEKNVRSGWVYLLEGQDSLYKIGLTTRPPDQRLAEISPKMPYSAKLIFTLWARDVYGFEKDLHGHFNDKRVNGEWFKLSSADVAWIKDGAE